jgi:hypothetical protein
VIIDDEHGRTHAADRPTPNRELTWGQPQSDGRRDCGQPRCVARPGAPALSPKAGRVAETRTRPGRRPSEGSCRVSDKPARQMKQQSAPTSHVHDP